MLFIVEENSCGVLSSAIDKLSTRISWINNFPKMLKQLFIGEFAWVECHLDAFNMLGFPGRNLFVGRVFYASASVARYHRQDTGDFLQIRFYTPKAASGQSGDGLFLCQQVLRSEKKKENKNTHKISIRGYIAFVKPLSFLIFLTIYCRQDC